MKVEYLICKERKFMIEVFYNEINLHDLERVVENQLKHPDFMSIDKVLTDARKSTIVIKANEIDAYVQGLKEQLNLMSLKWAIVVNDPRSTALSLLLQNDSYFKNKVEIFATLPAACEFLEIELKEEELLSSKFITIK